MNSTSRIPAALFVPAASTASDGSSAGAFRRDSRPINIAAGRGAPWVPVVETPFQFGAILERVI